MLRPLAVVFAGALFVTSAIVACGDTAATPFDNVSDTPDASGLGDAAAPPSADATAPSPDGGDDAGRCVPRAPLPPGEHTFMLDGQERRYLLHLPAGYAADAGAASSRAWPVVFALHGNGGTPEYWNATTGDRNLRGEVGEHAILVLAHAIGGNWRDYDAPPETRPARMDMELRYFDAILEQLRGSFCVNDAQIFAMGFSGGGSFAGVLGCQRDYIRAIASGGMVIYFDPAKCTHTPAAWLTMGAQELAERGTTFRDFFRGRAGCAATSAATAPAPCVAYAECNAATPVHYCQHPGGHVWPNFGTAAAWQFFSQFVD